MGPEETQLDNEVQPTETPIRADEDDEVGSSSEWHTGQRDDKTCSAGDVKREHGEKRRKKRRNKASLQVLE